MKRSELFNLYNKLQGLRSYNDNKRFSYALIKNIKIIQEEIEKLNEIIKPNDEFLKFEDERIQICNSHCVKDENGEPDLDGDEFKIIDKDKFDESLKPLKEKHNTTLNQRQQQIEKYNSMLDDNIEIELSKVGPDDLPDNITSNELEDIYPMLL